MSDWILVTGGTGYIGSHTCVELMQAGYDVCIVDSLVNSRASVAARIARLAGRRVELQTGDVRDRAFLDRVLSERRYAAVIHFAGLKAVGESITTPIRYYDVNVGGTLRLLEGMSAHGVERIVFSSSATVYGEPRSLPLVEDHPLAPSNPYGHTKLAIEQMLGDVASSRSGFRAVMLRYFNPVGAHQSGILGEDPAGIPNNLMPYVSQVAVGRLKELAVFGNDYLTPDGTGVRDYVHVVDLARAHVSALVALPRLQGATCVNLGTGRGYSVLEVVSAFERASGRPIPYRIEPRRPGDVAASYTDPSLARRLLGWRAERGLDEMCRDAWRWQQWSAANAAEL
ncbi:MAG: UDP-glucose 4-epimerase GalE [Betaproteobacteria bacterium]|nr:MAG: UDP-glucose 4-epimerase GalE [Betaproteobacteria bacterium]